MNVADYVPAVSEHCPYLAPSMARGLTGWTVYEIVGDPEPTEAEIFHVGVQAAEWARPLTTRPHGTLVCENIVLLVGDGADHRSLMTWPHWALKNLYGPVGLMFGKFRTANSAPSATAAVSRRPRVRFSPCGRRSARAIPVFCTGHRNSPPPWPVRRTTDAMCSGTSHRTGRRYGHGRNS
ncbi:hypothetical protein [Streptomyces sp. NPDC059080]|uniref:hypothetical protein n=1 Tax=Streptomyces sp. NPDC059080 TaxID=3346718 RepID=UPI0036CFB86B